MSIFRRDRPSRGETRLVPRWALDELPAIGRGAFVELQPPVDVSYFYLSAFNATGCPSPGTSEWAAFVDSFLSELVAAAESEGEWAIVGAFHVAKDLVGGDLSNQQYVDLVDRAMDVLHGLGVPFSTLPPFALARWRDRNRGGPSW